MISSPTLLLDESKCMASIQRMAEKAEKHNLLLKPHFKTHNSADVGEWFRKVGVTAVTVSSITMAEYFANHGWDDITIAFPVNPRTIYQIKNLAETIRLSLFIADPETMELVANNIPESINIYIEIDTGAGRTGILPENKTGIEELIKSIQSYKNLRFKGFYSHPGHSYAARSKEEIIDIHRDVLDKMQSLKLHFEVTGDQVACCIGDTPCCSVAENFEGIDEISPGNFVFCDLMQVQISSCSIDEIAVALASPVVAKHPERREVIVHGGAIHLSKERIEWSGNEIYGLPVQLSDNDSWSAPSNDSYLKSLSQEHGILKCSDQLFHSLEIGDLIGILPVHSCLTANLMKDYYLLDKNILSGN